jgi:creatinine amidohydrolase
MKKTFVTIGAMVIAAGLLASVHAQGPGQRREPDPRSMGGGDCRDNPLNCRDTPNPLPPHDTVWIEEMTWMDVRDALAAGKTTAIISTGGVEPNGPWLVTGKHNYVLRANCNATARLLGNALCAPVIPLVPEGGIDPPTGHMTSPGTISMRQETYEAMLTDVAHSLKMHGFKTIVFIGDSGGNQMGQRNVAERLNKQFGDEAIVAHIQEYYDYNAVTQYMADNGLVQPANDRIHDDAIITLNMLYDDPDSVRYDARVKAGHAMINGVSIADRAQAMKWAKMIVDFRAKVTADAINKAIANKGTLPAQPRTRPGQ